GRGQEGQGFRAGRPHPPGSAGAGHRAQGQRPRHELGESLMGTTSPKPAASGEPSDSRASNNALVTPPYWDEACKHLSKRDRVMRKLIAEHGSARLYSRGDAFTTLARSIVGQQISVKAAQSVWEKLLTLFGQQPPEQRAPLSVAGVLALSTEQLRQV